MEGEVTPIFGASPDVDAGLMSGMPCCTRYWPSGRVMPELYSPITSGTLSTEGSLSAASIAICRCRRYSTVEGRCGSRC